MTARPSVVASPFARIRVIYRIVIKNKIKIKIYRIVIKIKIKIYRIVIKIKIKIRVIYHIVNK